VQSEREKRRQVTGRLYAATSYQYESNQPDKRIALGERPEVSLENPPPIRQSNEGLNSLLESGESERQQQADIQRDRLTSRRE